jgi:hypothetical protein
MDAGMAIESHLDPKESSCELSNVAIEQCAPEESRMGLRVASVYLILGAQSGRWINSTQNDVSHGGSFATSEDSDSFDFRYIACCNNTGKNTFQFEDLGAESICSHVNVLGCHGSLGQFESEYTIFVLTGSVLRFERGAIFFSPANALSTGGDLTFVKVYTDLKEDTPVISGRLTVIKSVFALETVRTAKLNGIVACSFQWETPARPTPNRVAELESGLEETSGIMGFVVTAVVAGVLLFCYSKFFRRPDYARMPR